MMKASPLVSVGLPTYNDPQGLEVALQQLLRQTYENLEIILSDNASNISEVSIVIDRFVKQDKRIVLFKQKTNIGMLPNHKFVVLNAKGDYFLWLHGKDEFPPNYIEGCMERFSDAPDIELVGPRSDRFLDGRFWYSYDNYSSVGEDVYSRLRRLIPIAYDNPNVFEQHWFGVFRRETLLACLWGDEYYIRGEITLFFKVSERGSIQLADDIVHIKQSTKGDLEKYARAEYVYRPWWLRVLGRRMEWVLPVTGSMLSTIVRSKRLNFVEKTGLILVCCGSFSRYTGMAIGKGVRWLRVRAALRARFRRMTASMSK